MAHVGLGFGPCVPFRCVTIRKGMGHIKYNIEFISSTSIPLLLHEVMTTTPDGPYEYRTYPARFLGFFSISMLNLAASFVWLSYAAVPDPAIAHLNCSDGVVSLPPYLLCHLCHYGACLWLHDGEARRQKDAFLWAGRTTATMLGSISNAFSVAVAQVVIPFLTKDKASVKTTLLV